MASLVFVLEIFRIFGHVEVAAVINETIFVRSLNNILRVLQVVAIVVHVPVRRKFNIRKGAQLTSFFARV